MSKKTSYLWRRNLLQTNFNNNKQITTRTINPILEQSLSNQQNKEINYHRKLFKTANTTRRYAKSKDKFRILNCVPNNRLRLPTTTTNTSPFAATTTTRRNVSKDLQFNENLLWHKEEATNSIVNLNKNCQNNENVHFNPNTNMNCKCSLKLVNLSYPQRYQMHMQQKHLKIHKSFNTFQAPKTHSLAPQHTSCNNGKMLKCLSHVHHVKPLKMDKNHHHHSPHHHHPLSLYYGDVLHKVGDGVCVSNLIQLCKYHDAHHHHLRHHDSQLTWLPQVLHHQEHLLGSFEVLPPLFLLKSSPLLTTSCVTNKPGIIAKNQTQTLDANHSDVSCLKSKMSHSLPLKGVQHNNLDYQRIMEYLHKIKSKPSDRDVIFGNACLLLSKRYGWETSRIEWLLKLEQKYEL